MSDTCETLLPDDMLTRFRERAAITDQENRFFSEDLEELRASGYLAAPVPNTMGGSGLGLAELIRHQRRLAAYAPATALGVNMHLVWVQVARFLHDRAHRPPETGNDGSVTSRLDWVLHDAVADEVFGFGISEAGNDAVLMDAHARAAADDAGYLVSGTKIFTTLSPVWTRLGVHARCESEGEEPRLLFGFVRRDHGKLSEGDMTHPGTWNPLGMRATQSWNTRLDRVRIHTEDIAAEMPPFDGADPLILAIFSSFSLLTASVYAGIGDRALEIARDAANRPLPGAGPAADPDTDAAEPPTRLDDPDTAARLTAAVLDHRAALDQLDILARDIDELRVRDDWFVALAAAKNRVTDEARAAVDVAMRVGGARGYQADSELARIYRDVLAGVFHPSSSRSLVASVRTMLEG